MQGFSVTCLFTGQYNTKGYDTITFGFLVLVPTIAYYLLFNIGAIILRPDKYNTGTHIFIKSLNTVAQIRNLF